MNTDKLVQGIVLGLVVSRLTAAAPSQAAVNPTVGPDVFYVSGSTRKISQLIGDLDYQWRVPTETRTQSRVGITGSDLGVPFTHKGRTYLVFGDTQGGGVYGDRDPMAFTTDTDLEDGLDLTFLQNGAAWRPITIPGISQGAFEVPLGGVSLGDRLYLYHTTDHSATVTMGRSVVAVSTNDGRDFRLLYTLSRNSFINVSVSKVNVKDWPGFPFSSGKGLVLFGSGSYRASNVRLAVQPAAEVEDPAALRFFAGLDASGNPTWTTTETDAIDLFYQPCVGELSVAYNKFIRRWVMLYNCDNPRGINFRTALQPWGPWSQPQVLFEPWNDLGYGHFMHANWTFRVIDNVHNPSRQNQWGGEYGPYLFPEHATGRDNRTTIYFTLSSWNPYVAVLMKSELTVRDTPVITVPPADQTVAPGETAAFQLTASAVGPLTYQWWEEGTNIPGATNLVFTIPAVTPADDGVSLRCMVSSGFGSVTSKSARLSVATGNAAPVARIVRPVEASSYVGGDVIAFSGEASDPEDGELPASAFRWRVVFHHGNHTVPFTGVIEGVKEGAFAVPTRGEQATNVFYRVHLTVTDSDGRSTTEFRDVRPRVTTLALQTEPPGLQVVLDGQALIAPANVPSVVGMKRVLGVVNPGTLGGRTYDFGSWSDAGSVSHTIMVPEISSAFKAAFRTPRVLVSTMSSWKYLVTAVAPPAAWRNIVFDDNLWPSGDARLGYGDGDEATTIGWGSNPYNRFITTYFRRSFLVANPSAVRALLLRLLRDDGGVVYLNGTEVFRSNLGGGAPLHNMEAPNDVQGADETTYFYSTNVPTGVLVAGTNVVAVEIHQFNRTSPDLSFNLELRSVENIAPIADASATLPLWVSGNNQNAAVVLDGSRSSDPDGDPLTYAWCSALNAQPSIPIATGMVAVVSLPVGTNIIELVVDDGMAQDTNTITIIVLTAEQAVQRLITLVNASGLQDKQPLLATLNAALASIQRGNCHSAVGQLHAFQNKVRAQVTDPVLASELIEGASQAIAALGCDGSTRVAPRICSLKRQANGRLQMQIEGTANQIYLLEASTNLVNWQSIGTTTLPADGSFEFEDPDAAKFQSRYYRLVGW